jgi:S-adenosylmethionine synthetase
MGSNIVVSESLGQLIDDIPVEFVERKGIGHPDSLCDGIAERVSREYTRWCEENLGEVLHHNFDKVQLVAGEVSVHFGGGDLIKPIRIQLAGRGTLQFNDRLVPMDTIAIEAAKQHIRETMRYLDPNKHVVVDSYAGRGASELMDQVVNVMANDTSFGCSHWPRSSLENCVYETAQFINYKLINQFAVGEDIKVMGCRSGEAMTLTVSLPLIASRIDDATMYEEAKAGAKAVIQEFAQALDHRRLVVHVNAADWPERGAYYLTLTGTSAEMGDDGAVGRGNRVNGLITPFRTASLEAAAGKNPISHVGKIYNLMAFLIAQDIVFKIPAIRDVSVYLLSQIGHPLDQPWMATAMVHLKAGNLTSAVRADVEAVIEEHLQNDPLRIRARIASGELKMF